MQDSSERFARESTRFARGAVSGMTELWLGSARLMGDLALNWNDSVSRARTRADDNNGEKRTGIEPMRQLIELSGDITRDSSRAAGDITKVIQASVDAFTSIINEGQAQPTTSEKPTSETTTAAKAPTPPKA